LNNNLIEYLRSKLITMRVLFIILLDSTWRWPVYRPKHIVLYTL
jgi:hypothetical protein